MRKPAISVVTLGLAALGIALPASAHAVSGCNAQWPGRDGNVRAWRDADCQGELLGVTPGNDPHRGDAAGPFQGTDANAASSVMNSGFIGGKDVVEPDRISRTGSPTGRTTSAGHGPHRPWPA